MKSKTTYLILAIIVIGGLYACARFMFGIFTPYNAWTARQDIREGKIQIIAIGEMTLDFQQKRILADSLGFSIILHGCNVGTDILNGTKYYNKTMIEYLENRNGKGWWSKFGSRLGF